MTYEEIIKNVRSNENPLTDIGETKKTKSKKGKKDKKAKNKKNRTEDELRVVNLAIKVEEYRRRYWASHAKAIGKSVTELIIESLIEKLGDPDLSPSSGNVESNPSLEV
jgi:hypothetical protein